MIANQDSATRSDTMNKFRKFWWEREEQSKIIFGLLPLHCIMEVYIYTTLRSSILARKDEGKDRITSLIQKSTIYTQIHFPK